VIVPADSVWDDFFDSPGIELGDRIRQPADGRESF
jgi:antitoxin VapB